MKPLSFSVSLADPSDKLSIAILHALVFSGDLAIRVLFPRDPFLEAQISWILDMFHRAELEPDFHCIKAVDDDGKIIGAAMVQSKPPIGDPSRWGLFASVQNQDFFKSFFPQSKSIIQKRFSNRRPAGWNTLAVHPEYQRCGVGSALLRYGLIDLNMRSETVLVNSLFPVQDLYKKFGWEVIGEIEADLSDWAGKNVGFGPYKNVIMAREPSDTVL